MTSKYRWTAIVLLSDKFQIDMKSITAFFLLIVMCSCLNEEFDQKLDSSSNKISFTLVNTSSSAPFTKGTRAVDALYQNEKAINRLEILFYDETGITCLFHPEASQTKIENNHVTITIPEQVVEDKLKGQPLMVYVLANCKLDRKEIEVLPLKDLQQLVVENEPQSLFNQKDAPVDFIMDNEALRTTIQGDQNQNLGNILLKRAAAKIIVDIINATVPGYTPGKATVLLSNYLDKTTIGRSFQYDPFQFGSGQDYKSGVRELTPKNDGAHSYFMDASNPLYSYSNDWSENMRGETYATIALEWYQGSSVEPIVYYYRIPFQFAGGEGNVDGNQYKLRRNFIYQFLVNVTQLGGLDPESALELRANFDIIDWTTHKLDASLVQFDYMYVYNPVVHLYNQADYKWEYKSSKPISFEIEKVMCNYYERSGAIKEQIYSDGDEQYPKITDLGEVIAGSGKTFFKLESMVPINYVPLYINLKVTNTANMSEKVVLMIYPPRYVTALHSTNKDTSGKDYLAGAWKSPNEKGSTSGGTNQGYGTNYTLGSSGQTNFNLFTVATTTLTLQDMNKGYKVGDPTKLIQHPLSNWNKMDYYQTLTSAEANKIISPQFVVASQRGITTPQSWSYQQNRCASYREFPYPSGSWRVPTTAELEIISAMQRDENSAIKDLFVPSGNSNGWWAAEVTTGSKHNAVNLATGVVTSSDKNQSVRCVHDVWRDKK